MHIVVMLGSSKSSSLRRQKALKRKVHGPLSIFCWIEESKEFQLVKRRKDVIVVAARRKLMGW